VQNPTAEKGVSVTSKKIARAAYAENGIEETAESAVLVTLTVTPENADLKSTAFTPRWKNAASEWATGKEVSDYIEVKKYPTNQTQETLRQATISLKQPFGEVIEVQASVTDLTDKTVGTVITCNYIKRIEETVLTMTNGDEPAGTPFDGYIHFSNGHGATPYNLSVACTFGVGTVTPTITKTARIELSPEVVNGMKQAAYDLDHDQAFEPSLKAINKFYKYGDNLQWRTSVSAYTLFWGDDVTTDEEKEIYRKYLVQALSKCTGSCYDVVAEITATYGTFTEEKTVNLPRNTESYSTLRIDYSGIIKSTDNVTADTPNIEF